MTITFAISLLFILTSLSTPDLNLPFQSLRAMYSYCSHREQTTTLLFCSHFLFGIDLEKLRAQLQTYLQVFLQSALPFHFPA